MEHEGPRQTVLVVDDDPAIRGMLALMLELDGLRTLTAPDGPTALEVVAKEEVDLITLDVMMPHMDGWEVADRLQRDPNTRTIPRVMLSGLPIDALMRACSAKQAAAIVTKPFDYAQLSALICELLGEQPFLPWPRRILDSTGPESAEAPHTAGLQELLGD